MTISKREDGLYWPDSDINGCYEWTNTELYTIDIVVETSVLRRSIIHAGGNVGSYALKFSNSFETVYVFEPNYENFKCLALNTAEKENIFPFRSALGNTPGQISMVNTNSDNCGTFQVKGPGTIPLLTIDSLNLADVDCIHLDIEGYELPALMGAIQTIKRCKPLLVVEWLNHGENYGWTKEDMINFLVNLGYTRMKQIGSDMMFKHES